MGDRGRQMLDVLMGRRGEWTTRCVYCNRDVVNMRLMPKEFEPRYLGGYDKVSFTINGRRHMALAVTADHYLDRCYGGRSDLNNILPACRPCNNRRSHGRDWPMCIDCRINRRTHGKRCAGCRRNNDLRALDNDERQRRESALLRSVRQSLIHRTALAAIEGS